MRILLLYFFLIGRLIAAESVVELTYKAENLQSKIEEENKLWAEEKKIETENEQKRKKQYDELLQEKEQYNKIIVETDDKIKKRIDDFAKVKNAVAENSLWLDKARVQIDKLSKHADSLLQTSFQYQRDMRMRGIELLHLDLESQKISAEEGLTRLWNFYKNEHQMATESELYSGTITSKEGNVIPVKYLRIGKQIMMYRSDDDLYMGVMKQGIKAGEYVWVTGDELNYEQRQSIRDAVATAEGKLPPGFVPVPVWFNLGNSGK